MEIKLRSFSEIDIVAYDLVLNNNDNLPKAQKKDGLKPSAKKET